jgi:hypothetical protein
MKLRFLGLAVFSSLLFIGANSVLAEDSVNIQVSCTIPAIPGLNSPLLEAQSIVAAPPASKAENQQLTIKTQLEQPLITIQEESKEKEDQKNSESGKNIVLVKTFYVR